MEFIRKKYHEFEPVIFKVPTIVLLLHHNVNIIRSHPEAKYLRLKTTFYATRYRNKRIVHVFNHATLYVTNESAFVTKPITNIAIFNQTLEYQHLPSPIMLIKPSIFQQVTRLGRNESTTARN